MILVLECGSSCGVWYLVSVLESCAVVVFVLRHLDRLLLAQMAFQRHDADRSGMIEAGELQAAIREFGACRDLAVARPIRRVYFCA